ERLKFPDGHGGVGVEHAAHEALADFALNVLAHARAGDIEADREQVHLSELVHLVLLLRDPAIVHRFALVGRPRSGLPLTKGRFETTGKGLVWSTRKQKGTTYEYHEGGADQQGGRRI